jgi:prepilin-type processing-associated H-X9-DG protein
VSSHVPGSVAEANVSNFARPSELVLAGDTTLHAHGRSDPAEWRRHLWHDRKHPWANLTFADGHVSFHKMDPDAPVDYVLHPVTGTRKQVLSRHGKGYTFVNAPTDPYLDLANW